MFKRSAFFLLILTLFMMAGVVAAQDKEPLDTDPVDTEDWQTVQSETYRFLLPEGWVSAEDLSDEEIDEFSAVNPQIGATVDIGAEVYYINPETAGSLNITFLDAEVAVTLEEVESIFVGGYPDMGITVEDTEIMEMSTRDVLRMTLTLDFPLDDGGVLPLTQYQYAVVEDTLVHLLTINNGTEPLEDAEKTFDAVVDSLELIDGEAVLEATPEAEATEEIAEDGEFRTIEGDGISLDVPANWTDVSDGMMDAGVQAALEANPELEAMMETQAGANFIINVFDLETGANLNVNVIEFPPGLTLDVIEPVLVEEYANLGIDVLETTIIELNGDDVLRVQAQLGLNDVTGEAILLDQFQYIYLEDTQAYILTLTAGDVPLEEIQPTFELIAESVVIE